jgi:hypothetical protein
MPRTRISADSKQINEIDFHSRSYIFHLVNEVYKIKTYDSSIVFFFLPTSCKLPIVYFFKSVFYLDHKDGSPCHYIDVKLLR